MLNLNYRDPRPIYEQIKNEFQKLILTGALASNEKLPSVRELAAQLSINPNTIQRAYRDLEASGYIFSLAGKGSFVADITAIKKQKHLAAEAAFCHAAGALRALGYSEQELTALLRERKEPSSL